jgi:hypothetical protein
MIDRAASSPSPYEARVTVALRRAKLLAIGDVNPAQGAALWSLGLLEARDIGTLAAAWLERGQDNASPELAALALDPPSSLSLAGPSFEAALAEVGVAIPSLDEPVLVALQMYLRAIVERRLPPMAAMAAIDDLYHRRGDARLHHPNRRPDDPEQYLGAELGLEHLYTWYRELQDAKDGSALFYYNDLPRDRQLAKFEEHLIAEAEFLHRHLCRTHPELSGAA